MPFLLYATLETITEQALLLGFSTIIESQGLNHGKRLKEHIQAMPIALNTRESLLLTNAQVLEMIERTWAPGPIPLRPEPSIQFEWYQGFWQLKHAHHGRFEMKLCNSGETIGLAIFTWDAAIMLHVAAAATPHVTQWESGWCNTRGEIVEDVEGGPYDLEKAVRLAKEAGERRADY